MMSKEDVDIKKNASTENGKPEPFDTSENSVSQNKSWSSRRLWPVYMSSFATILWIIGVSYLAYLKGLFTSGVLISVSDFAIFAGGLTSPIVVFWLITLVYQRTDPLLERRIEISMGMEKTLDPIDAAEKKLNIISSNIKKQIDLIEASTDIALQSIENLENRFQDQVNQLFTATTDAEVKGENLKKMLMLERQVMESYAADLEKRTKDIETSLSSLTGLVENTVHSIKSEVLEAGKIFKERASTTKAEYEAATKYLENIGTTLENQSREIKATSKDAQNQMEETFESIMAHSGTLAREMDKIDLKGRNLGEELKKQAKSLTSISTEAIEHADKFEQAVSRQTDKLSSAAAGALSQAAQAGNAFEKQAQTIEKVASDTLQRTENIFVEAGRGIANSSAAAENSAQGAAEVAFQHINKATNAIEALSTKMEISAKKATDETVNNIKHLQDGLAEQARIIQETTKSNSSELEGATQRLADHAEMIASAAQKAAEGLLSAGDVMDKRGNNLGQVLGETKLNLQQVESDLNKQRSDLADVADHSLTIMSEAANQFEENAEKLQLTANTISDDLSTHSEGLDHQISKLGKRGDVTSSLFVSASKKLREENKAFGNSIKMNLGYFEEGAQLFGEKHNKFIDESTETIQKLNLGTKALIQRTTFMINSSDAGAERMDILTKKINTASKAADANAETVLSKVKATIEETKSGIKSSLDELQNKAQEDMTNVHLNFTRLVEASSQSLANAHNKVSEESLKTEKDISKATERLIGNAKLFIDQSTNFNKKLKLSSKDDFIKTSSLLIEGLNSAALDVTRLLDVDIPDTVWKKYLKGDKSIFSRHAIKIGNRKTKKKIIQKFEEDNEFKNNVLRFMGDFENLLERSMYEQKGNTLSVTLLSSEMGKLYVLLAQSLKKLN
ncbi:MAG: hypothetical protein ACKVIX_07400 [Sphingomonadales bacterium]